MATKIAVACRKKNMVEKNFFEEVPNAEILAIAHPDWLGIRSSSREMFSDHLYIGDDIDDQKAARIAAEIAKKVTKAVVLQAFPLNYEKLVYAINRYANGLPIYCIWHGSFLQSNEDINWRGFRKVCELNRKGLIQKLAFVKEGMAEIMNATGMKTYFLKNWLNRIPEKVNEVRDDGFTHCAVWSSTWCWRKPAFSMLAAAGTRPGTKAHIYGVNQYITEFIDELSLNVVRHNDHIPWQQMTQEYMKMHLNLYVTMSECAPMVPLESLSCGVPCLFGPNSHYFLDNKFLYTMLVVQIPDSAQCIKNYINRALEAREDIVNEYIRYAKGYNQECKDLLRHFLES